MDVLLAESLAAVKVERLGYRLERKMFLALFFVFLHGRWFIKETRAAAIWGLSLIEDAWLSIIFLRHAEEVWMGKDKEALEFNCIQEARGFDDRTTLPSPASTPRCSACEAYRGCITLLDTGVLGGDKHRAQSRIIHILTHFNPWGIQELGVLLAVLNSHAYLCVIWMFYGGKHFTCRQL